MKYAALGMEKENPQRETSEDLECTARPPTVIIISSKKSNLRGNAQRVIFLPFQLDNAQFRLNMIRWFSELRAQKDPLHTIFSVPLRLLKRRVKYSCHGL